MPSPAEDHFEFGPFRLEPSTGCLYRGDDFIPLTPKAFETLCLLVQEAGRLVTKDEILARVWPDAFVEEGSIANNISALRKILNPHFEGDGPIATVSRRGYRFTAPVHLRNARAQNAGVLDVAKSDAVASVAGRGYGPLAIAAAVLIAMTGFGIYVTAMRVTTANPPNPTGAPAVRRAVAVLSMQNLSGRDEHAWFSTALAEAINTDLNAGGTLRIISGAAVAEMQQQLAQHPGVGLSRKQLDDIGRNLGCDLILTGTYLHSGGRVRVDLRLDDIATGAPVAAVSVEESEDQLLDLVAVVSRDLRTRLGLAPPLAGHAEAVRAAFSSNPAALRFYFLGLDALRNHEISRAIELLTQAVGEDPDFALAYAAMSTSWRVLGRDGESEAAARRAFELSPRLGREDQLLVQGAYYAVMNDAPRAREKFQALWNFFPDDIAYGLRLTHQQLLGGELDAARRTIDQMRALPPPADSDPRVDVVESDWLFRKARYAEALQVAEAGAAKARRRKSNQILAILTMTQGRSATGLGDFASARRYIAGAQRLYEGLGDAGGVGEAVLADAVALAANGQPLEAERRLDAAHEGAMKLNHQRLLVNIRIRRSEVALTLGKLERARADAEAALAAARAMQHHGAVAQALVALGCATAAQGDAAVARRHFEEAERVAQAIGEPAPAAAAAEQLARMREAAARSEPK